MISVIVPTYNRASFLKGAIESVRNQEYFHPPHSLSYELLVVDDGSTDNTRDVVGCYGEKVKYTFQKHKGVSAARNRGLELARGNFIAFLDSDDLWRREKIGEQVGFMKAFPGAKACYTDERWIRRGVFVNPKMRHRKYSGWIFDKVLPLCLISLSSALFRREVFAHVGTFDENLPACEDYDFGIRLAQKYPVYFIPKPLIIKRGGHSDQLSRKYWGMDRFRIYALEKALYLDLTPGQKELVKRQIVRKCQILVNGFKKRNKITEAENYMPLIEKYGPQTAAKRRRNECLKGDS